jgi:hypothetical protein
MSITADNVSNVLFDRLLQSVATEVELVIHDYAHKFVNKI